MKKQVYFPPVCQVIKVKAESLLTTSTMSQGGDGDQAGSRQFIWDDEEEDE